MGNKEFMHTMAWMTTEHELFSNKLFNLSSHCHIYVVQYLFTSSGDKFENLGETSVLA